MTLNFIAADVFAWKDVWIVGDQFLQTMYGTLTAMKNQAYKSNKKALYIHDYYNVKAYWKYSPSMTITSTIARISNGLVEALNDSVKLPRIILFLPGSDILCKAAFYNIGASMVIGDNVEWLIECCVNLIETRKWICKI